MKIISLGRINIKFLIPILGGIIRLIYKYIIVLNDKYEALTINPFLLSIYTYIGMILAFIPYLIRNYRSKKSYINPDIFPNESKLNIKLIFHNDIFKKTRFNKYKYIVIASIFDFISTLLSYVFCMNVVYNLWIFDIIFISIFSYFILGSKFYRHQYLSMIIILVLGFILNIIEYIKLDESENSFSLIDVFIKFLTEIFFCLTIVIIKYNLEKNYSSPYELCIWEGAIGLILHIICLVIINSLELTIGGNEYPKNIKYYFDNYNINDFIESLIVIITGFVFNISLMLTCNYFTPAHVLITSIIKEYHYYLQKGEYPVLNIIGFLILVIILFAFLIFVEIIEINIFNISFNTKKNIERRSRLDSYLDINNIGLNDEKILEDEDSLNSTFSTNNKNV